MTSATTPPSRALLILAGLLTQLIGAVCLVLGLASLPVVHDLKGGMTGVAASVIAAFAAIVCGTLVWRGRLIPLALATGLDIGFGIGLPRGGSAINAILRMLPADEVHTAETIVMVAAVAMFVAAILCVLAVPSALRLRQWARTEIAASREMTAVSASELAATGLVLPPSLAVDETAPTRERERPSFAQRPSQMPLPAPALTPMPLPPPYNQPAGAPPGMPPYAPHAHQAAYPPHIPYPGGPPSTAPPSSTLRGFPAQKLVPTQVIHIGPQGTRRKTFVILGVAVTLIAIGVLVIIAATGGDTQTVASTGSGSSTKPTTTQGGTASATAATGSGEAVAATGSDSAGSEGSAGSAEAGSAVVEPPSITGFLDRFHAALGSVATAELSPLFDPKAFAFGADGNDLAEGRDAIVEQLRGDLGGGGTVTVRFSLTGQEGDTGWLAEELKIGSTVYAITAGLALRGDSWVIGGLHVGLPLANATAYKLAREGNATAPDVIPNTNDTSELARAMQTAFASKPSFVDARSTRADGFNFGSAPNERLKGGEAIRKLFTRIGAVMKLHDAVKVGPLGASGGWGVANVDFTETLRDGDVTQTFRVLAVWLKEPAGWRIVLTQWSNAR